MERAMNGGGALLDRGAGGDINRLLTWVLCMGLHLQLWLQAVWLYTSTSLRFAP